MCGIAGCFGTSDSASVTRMVQRIRHRGPDGSGVAAFPHAALGHTRLAILDVAGGAQPMSEGCATIVFNGEIYNHADLRARHLAGETFRTRTDTEVVLKLYKKLGPEFVQLLDGMFALAILDETGLFLARDPLGIKPLYLTHKGQALYFASELKALAEVSEQAEEFPAGHHYHSSQEKPVPYFNLLNSDIPPQFNTQEETQEGIRVVLRNAVTKRLMADVPVGVSLSGGVDSSIVALLAREGIRDLHTFGVGIEGAPDLEAARFMARFLGSTHHEYVYTEMEIRDILPEVLLSLESFDPALVRSAIANYFLARLTSQYVKVFLTGEGADEVYAGYEYLKDYQQPGELQAELVRITRSLHNTNLQRADRLSMAFSLEARVPFLDIESVRLGLSIPPAWKVHNGGGHSKALLRKAFTGKIPDEILFRPKLKFSQGAGSSTLLVRAAEGSISDSEFEKCKNRLKNQWNFDLKNKEGLYYYKILNRFYPDSLIFPGMGSSRSL